MNAYEQMRDRIVKILWCCQWMYDNAGDESVKSHLMEPIRIAKEALALPRRQCDVGTVEEQERRYKATGEVYHTLTLTNALAWAQTPYAAEEGAGE